MSASSSRVANLGRASGASSSTLQPRAANTIQKRSRSPLEDDQVSESGTNVKKSRQPSNTTVREVKREETSLTGLDPFANENEEDHYYEWDYEDVDDMRKEVKALAREEKRWMTGIWTKGELPRDDSSDEEYVESEVEDQPSPAQGVVEEEDGEESEEESEEDFDHKQAFGIAVTIAAKGLAVEPQAIEDRIRNHWSDEGADAKLFRAFISSAISRGFELWEEIKNDTKEEEEKLDDIKVEVSYELAILLASRMLDEEPDNIRKRLGPALIGHGEQHLLFRRLLDLCLHRARKSFDHDWAGVAEDLVKKELERGPGEETIQALIEKARRN